MDDKKLEKMLNDYAKSSRQDKSEIIKTVHTEEVKERNKFFIPKKYLAVGVCVLVVAIALSVFLPLYLKPSEGENIPLSPETPLQPDITNPDIGYGNSYGPEINVVNSYEEIVEALEKEMLHLNLDNIKALMLTYADNNHQVIGSKIGYSIYGEAIADEIDVIDICCYHKYAEIPVDVNFMTYEKTITVNNISVNYRSNQNSVISYYFLNFEYDDLEYFITIECIDEIDPEIVLRELLP